MASKDPNEWNSKIIEEFRANDGVVGGMFEGMPMLLLHTAGAKTGHARTNPLAYQTLDNGYAVFASKGGAPTKPDWYYNCKANPAVSVEVGTHKLVANARIAGKQEREQIFNKQKELMPQFAEYEKSTSREIPVVVLEPS